MASADSWKSSSSTGDFPEKPHQPRSIKFPMRDTGKQKRTFNPKWFDQFTFLHYREDSDSVICHTCALADKGYTVIISGVFPLPCRKRTFVILSHFKASGMAKSLELLGEPPGTLPGLCRGSAGWLSAPPRPPAVIAIAKVRWIALEISPLKVFVEITALAIRLRFLISFLVVLNVSKILDYLVLGCI